ncbi:MAG: hypothetical protein JJD93_19025 [Ilumatobacteraceae bacterium]|nr:hypothetical protein [Ilumatobacteraceae bacterium]
MLKLFVSTTTTQGSVAGDFCYVPAGELVGRYSMVCDCERADGSGCGCGRAFGGFETHRGTTTAIVVERDMTELDWRVELYKTLSDTGWADAMPADDLAEFVDALVAHDLNAAAELPAGLIVGRRAWNEGDETVDQLMYRGVSDIDVGSRV